MMGHFFVYESYVDDIISDHHHDCMWSGHCYPCPDRTSFSTEVKEEQEQEQEEVDVVVVDAAGARSSFLVGRPDVLSPEPQILVQQLLQVPAANSQTPPAITLHANTPQSPQPVHHQVNTQLSSTTATTLGRPHKNKPANEGPKSKSKFYGRKKGNNQKQGHHPTPDTKKLRHREVEKNRHRLLQAMVKTLSERIPGRLDKETQVQTMKRAARYCVFLREIANEMSRVGEPVSGSALEGKLDKIYHVARDNVELLMSKK